MGGWWQKAKTKKQDDTLVEFRVAMMSMCTHKSQYSTTGPGQMCADSGNDISSPLPNGVISAPHCQMELFIGTISPVVDLHGRKKALWRSRPVDIRQ